MRALLSCLPFFVALSALSGCKRSLPGPDECRAFALATLGVSPVTPATQLARAPAIAARAEELTRRCLATPWDYELLNCLGRGGNEYVCMQRFEQRRREPLQDQPARRLPGF